MSDAFNKFAASIFSKPNFHPPLWQKIMCFDPGETTGWSFWSSVIDTTGHTTQPERVIAKTDISPGFVSLDQFTPVPSWHITAQGQLDTWPIENAILNIGALLDEHQPQFVVFERYSVYGWKAASHSWSEVPTIQVIGVIQTLCTQRHLKFVDQTAQVAKGFATDSNLRKFNLYSAGQRHARDSVRHGVYYILFGNRQV